jgi:hypothetical protein
MKSYGSSFTATNASWTKTKTCTTTDGKTVAITKGRYSGAASGDPDLAGPIRLAAHSVINTTDGVGFVDGRLRLDTTDGVGFVDGRLRLDVPGRDTVANFTAVYDHGALAGFARGPRADPACEAARQHLRWPQLRWGFADGKLGNSAGGSAVEVGPGACLPKPGVEKSAARGTVSALSQGSIAVRRGRRNQPPLLRV